MNVNKFSDHIAYTLEDQEVIFSIGNKILEKLNRKELLSGLITTVDGHQRILYCIVNEIKLTDMIGKVDAYELCGILEQLVSVIDEISTSDFLCKEAIDININRIYYNSSAKSVRCIALPFNREYPIQGEETWNEKFMCLMSVLLASIYGEYAKSYVDYIKSEDNSWEDKMNFLKKVRRKQENKSSASRMILRTRDNTTYIVMTEDEMILGSSEQLKGQIIAASVSRNHCKVFKYVDRYVVQDLNSTNGTRINGFQLEPEKSYYLSRGDCLQLADVELLVEICEEGDAV